MTDINLPDKIRLMGKVKIFKVYYRKRGGDKPISYVMVRSKNVKDAKEDARSQIWLTMKDSRGAIQLNAYMKSIVFYIVK